MRNLGFDDMHLFARVAELGTLSAVARERDVPVSQISRSLARIEKACGTRLLHRSTHGLAPTAEGDTFLQYCQRIVGPLDELEGEFAGQTQQATGWVRVAASTVVAEYLLAPSFASLTLRHPQLCVDLQVDDRLVDMARDGIDIAIRSGTLATDTVVARQIGALGRRLYATPGYLQTHGTPQHPDELHRHRLITNSGVPLLNHWPFVIDGKPSVIVPKACWRSDNTGMTATLTLQGLGISRCATLVAEPLVRRGLLVPVLADFVDEQPSPIYAVTLTNRHRLPKIKACIDHWAEWLDNNTSTSA
ncbi:MAG: LysR family transcriptional regulator [Polaromonas sp.]